MKGQKKQLGLAFSYDNYARLLYVDSYETPNELLYGEFTELFDYDKNGNIKFLARGLQDGYSQMASFEYDGNRIISIEDTSEGLPLSKTPRFEAGSYSAPFAYDACGRITMDKTRGINKVYYNELGQTTRIDFDNQSIISTAYDAQGVKRSSSEFARYIETLPPATNTLDSPDRAQQYQTYNRKVEFLGKLERIDGENIRIDVGDGFFTGVFNSNNWKFHHYAKNHLGSIVTVTNDSNKLEQHTFYFASGLPIIIDADNTQITNERFHIGKTFKTFNGLHWYDNEARQYDPLLVRFTTPDPMAENSPWNSSYVYCSNNPITRIDPNGMDDYRYDDNTGQFHLMKQTDDKTDRVLAYHLNKETGKYEQNTKWLQPKIRIDGIEKGILSDGINFKENDNVISVGGEGQPSVEGVEDFVMELSEMADVEISGYEYSQKGETEISNVYIGKYIKNTPYNARCSFNPRITGVLANEVTFHVDFHTHLSRFSELDRLNPSSTGAINDMTYKKEQLKHGIKKFIILTPDKNGELLHIEY